MWDEFPSEVSSVELGTVRDAWRGNPVDASKAALAAFKVAGVAHVKRGTTTADPSKLVFNDDVDTAFAAAAEDHETPADPAAWDLVARIAFKVIEKFRHRG